MTASSGQKVNLEHDDKSHPDQVYAEHDLAELFVDDTGATLTMASSPAELALGNTNNSGEDLANSVTARGVTVDLDDGTFAIDKAGVYRLYFCGRVEGEEDEDVTLKWQKDPGGSGAFADIGSPAESLIEFDASTGVSALGQPVSHECLVELAKGDLVRLVALGSASEVINFKRFNFGIEQVGSAAY